MKRSFFIVSLFLSTSSLFVLPLASQTAPAKQETPQEPVLSEPLQSDILLGRILFLVQQGDSQAAIKLYQKKWQLEKRHDFECLQSLAIKILEEGFQKKDPECQLLALFGASVSAHDEVYPLLAEGLKKPHPLMQLVALQALSSLHNERADQLIVKALGSPEKFIRLEAAKLLCQKKHPLSLSQTESLMYKTAKESLFVYPELFVIIGDTHSTRQLRKLLAHSQEAVKLQAILSIAKHEREDLLEEIRRQAAGFSLALQEAAAFTFGVFRDEASLPLLEKFSRSPTETVAFAAQIALHRMGKKIDIEKMRQAAAQGNLLAIDALHHLKAREELLSLLQHKNREVRLNALIALCEAEEPLAMAPAREILFKDKHHIALNSYHSPGQTLKAWKVTTSAATVLKEDPKAYTEHLELKEKLLEKLSYISPRDFIGLAQEIFTTPQNDLVPKSAHLLERIETQESIACLKRHYQKIGAPLVRMYCNLALYRLNEKGPYAENLRSWAKAQGKTEFIRFKPFVPWQEEGHPYALNLDESSQLLIEIFETFARKQDLEGVEALLDAMANGNQKNKYALAGLLLRATQ